MFLDGCVGKAPGGALNLPQECMWAYMPASSTPILSALGRLRGGRGHPLGERNFALET